MIFLIIRIIAGVFLYLVIGHIFGVTVVVHSAPRHLYEYNESKEVFRMMIKHPHSKAIYWTNAVLWPFGLLMVIVSTLRELAAKR